MYVFFFYLCSFIFIFFLFVISPFLAYNYDYYDYLIYFKIYCSSAFDFPMCNYDNILF